jgi:hypothetical protein
MSIGSPYFARDSGGASQLFADRYHLSVETLPRPSGYPLRICLFAAPRDRHENVCPQGTSPTAPCEPFDELELRGSYGTDDSADYFLRVFTDEPVLTCEEYVIHIRNGGSD